MSQTYQMDAVEWLKSLDDSSIDLFITDPPYESFEELFIEIFRVLKKGSHFYLFCDQETMFIAKPIAEKVGFKFWKPIVWDKCAIGMGYHYRARCEFILFFEKGKRKLNDLSVPDVLEYKRVWRGYPTEKPVELIEVLIKQSSSEKDVVVDSFFGSGSTLVAAKNLSREFLGCDISDSAHEHFNNRINK